jgi:acetyltransferase
VYPLPDFNRGGRLMSQHYLKHLFQPRAVAVFGASERPESVGGRILANLRQGGFAGPIHAINPKHQAVAGHPCHASLQQVPGPVDLAVIATPGPTVAAVLRDCGEHGVRAAIVITAGFGETGAAGKALEAELLAIAHQYRMRLLGPNCLGLMRPPLGLNATFSKSEARPGGLALVSQSGALCTAIVDWAQAHALGFSAIVSTGAAVDVDFGDVLDYLAQDPETQSILLYVEGVRHARSFMSGLRAAARLKPVIVLKAGRHEQGTLAAVTHTGAIVGGDDVFGAALERTGVVRALSIEQLFSAAQLLDNRCLTGGKRLCIITNGGGLGVMAIDRAVDLDLDLSALSAASVSALSAVLPAHWSHANPVDILGDAGPERYQAAVRACLADAEVDGLLVLLSPQAMTDGSACAQAVLAASHDADKPVLACWMGGTSLDAGRRLLADGGVPEFSSPEAAVEAFAFLTAHCDNQRLLMQVPGPLAPSSAPDVSKARQLIQQVLQQGRTLLDGVEARAVLQAFAIPVNPCVPCPSAEAAVAAAEALGYPVAMKIHSHDITHKSDVGGVRLSLGSAAAVREAYTQMLDTVRAKQPAARIMGVTLEPMVHSRNGRELMIGVLRDPVFGPAISFGAGGVNVEVLRDRAIALPPLNSFLSERMIAQTRIAPLLGAYRGQPAVPRAALVAALRSVSELCSEVPELVGLDINPLLADENGVVAIDARITVAAVPPTQERYAHMAIHPYPVHLVSRMQLADGTLLTIRPIRPEDAALEQAFMASLSSQTKHFRFMEELKELSRDLLVRFTQLDYDRELALIAVLEADATRAETEVGVARYVRNPDGRSCEFALVVADAWQGKGLGTRLMQELMQAATARGYREIQGEVLSDNHNMLQLMRELGFSVEAVPDDPQLRHVRKHLPQGDPSTAATA